MWHNLEALHWTDMWVLQHAALWRAVLDVSACISIWSWTNCLSCLLVTYQSCRISVVYHKSFFIFLMDTGENSNICNWTVKVVVLNCQILYAFTSPLGGGYKVLWCWMTVCLLTYLENHTAKLCQIFCVCCLWLWLGPHLAALWYIMYFDDVVFTQWPNHSSCVFQSNESITGKTTA